MQDKDIKNQNNLKDAELEKKEKEREKAIKEFIKLNTKEIEIKPLPVDIKTDLQKQAKELEDVKNEIEDKKLKCTDQIKSIKEKLDGLVKSGGIKVDQEQFNQSQQGLEHYKQVLDSLSSEIDTELNFCKDLTSDNPPKTLRVLKDSTDDFVEFTKTKIQSIKKYIKKVTKDLRVSYSKYNFGLESQKRRLEYLEVYLKRIKNKK